MKNYKNILVAISILAIIIVPAVSFAVAPPNSEGIVPPCGNDPITGECVWGYREFLTLINNVMDFIIYKLSLPIVAIMLAYAGFTLIFAQGGEGKTKAKTIFTNTIVGFIIVIAAVLIVKTILLVAGYQDTNLYF